MEPGTYKARAREWDYSRTKAGDVQVAVLFELTDAPAAGETITWFGSFKESVKARTLESLQHCGWDAQDIGTLGGMGTTECRLVIDWDDYQGNRQLKVRWVNALQGKLALKDTLSDAERRAFAMEMKGEVLALQAGKKNAPPPRPAPAARPEPRAPDELNGSSVEEDIPF